ncbi:MAG: PPOX class F420-dependent oxidoreductase [Pseudonocardiaceae bacterium]
MDLDQARKFLSTHHRAVLATLRADGAPQMSPVLVSIDDAGAAIISTRQTAYKVHNIRRDPRVWLCVLTDQFFGEWIQIEGTAEVVELPEAMDGLVTYYRSVSGEHPDWDEYRDAMRTEQRVLVRFDLAKAGPDRAG